MIIEQAVLVLVVLVAALVQATLAVVGLVALASVVVACVIARVAARWAIPAIRKITQRRRDGQWVARGGLATEPDGYLTRGRG